MVAEWKRWTSVADAVLDHSQEARRDHQQRAEAKQCDAKRPARVQTSRDSSVRVIALAACGRHSSRDQMSMSPVTIILTATIAPPVGMPGTIRNDPEIRLQEYARSLEFYLRLPSNIVRQIVVLENSDYPISALTAVAADHTAGAPVHFLKCPSDYQPEKGKGYGEFLMLDHGLRELRKRGLLTEHEHIWKITGRLQVSNMHRMVREAPEEYDMYCDLRHVPLIGDILGGNSWMELRILSFTLGFYQGFFMDKYDIAFVLEKGFYALAMESATDWKIVPRFRTQPIIEGFSGYSNVSYSNNLNTAKTVLRMAARQIVPRLWL